MNHISTPEKEDLTKIAMFISQMQQQKETTIGYFDGEADKIQLYLEELEPNWLKNTLIAKENDKIVGVIVAEHDVSLGRAWIHGPMVELAKWDALAINLYNNLIKILPPEIVDLELFGERENSNLCHLAELLDYTNTDPSFSMRFPKNKINDLPIVSTEPITEKHYPQFKELHQKIFPNTYYSSQQILDMQDDTHIIFIKTTNEQVEGFILGKLEKSIQQGYIEFVGVKESARRKGLGVSLVVGILHWLFDTFNQITEVLLTVSEPNIAAVKLYSSIGFEITQTLQGYRKK